MRTCILTDKCTNACTLNTKCYRISDASHSPQKAHLLEHSALTRAAWAKQKHTVRFLRLTRRLSGIYGIYGIYGIRGRCRRSRDSKPHSLNTTNASTSTRSPVHLPRAHTRTTHTRNGRTVTDRRTPLSTIPFDEYVAI
jgi:hypothetical protein